MSARPGTLRGTPRPRAEPCHNPPVTRPWTLPEVTGFGRLPMHSVAHDDRLALDGRWRFQLLASPDDEPGADWGETDVPGVWTMAGTWDRPHYTNVQMPFDGLPPEIPERNPTGVYERDIDLPDGWADRRVVLHVGAAESVLIVSLNGAQVGVGKDSHLASEFDLTGRLRPGRNTVTLRVVKWSDATYIEDQDQWWHGGITRSVFLYVTRDVHLADVRADAGLAADLSTGTLDLTVTVGFPGRELPRGWTVEASLDGVAETFRGDARSIDRSTLRGWTLDDQRLMYQAAAGLPLSGIEAASWADVYARMAPELDGLVTWHVDVPGVEPWSAERADALPVARRPARPGGRHRRGGDPPGRVPSSRGRGSGPAGQRRPRLHPGHQPPRLRPAHRSSHLGRDDARRPRADEAVRVQRRADIALPE